MTSLFATRAAIKSLLLFFKIQFGSSLRGVSSFQFSLVYYFFKVLFFVVALLVVVALNVITGTKRVSEQV